MDKYGIKLGSASGYALVINASSKESALNTFFYYADIDDNQDIGQSCSAEWLSRFVYESLLISQTIPVVDEYAS